MIIVRDMDSLLKQVQSLVLNHYEIRVKAVYCDFPREKNIDYFEIDLVGEIE